MPGRGFAFSTPYRDVGKSAKGIVGGMRSGKRKNKELEHPTEKGDAQKVSGAKKIVLENDINS